MPRPGEGMSSFSQLQPEIPSGFHAESNLAPVHAKNPRISARRRFSGHNDRSRKEAKLHESKCDIFREVEGLQNSCLTLRKLRQGSGR